MDKKYSSMRTDHRTFIQAQPVWFVATSLDGRPSGLPRVDRTAES